MSGFQVEDRNCALDGIRGVAIISVVIFHATMVLGHNFPPIRAMLHFGQAGWLGVEVFFALSGFLITRILLRTRGAPASRFFGTFYYRRALRIFPLYYGVLVALWLIATLYPTLNPEGAARFLEQQWWFWLHAANMLRELHGTNAPALEFGSFELTHFWTLAVEEHFYLFWPLLVYWLSSRWLGLLALGLIALSMALRSDLLEPSSPWMIAVCATPKHLAGLAIGGLAAIWQSHVSVHTIIRWTRLGLFASLTLLFVSYMVTEKTDQDATFRAFVALYAACAAACTALWVCASPAAAVSSWLSNSVLVTYGRYSYGIYVFHYLIGPLSRNVDLASWPGGYTLGIGLYVALYLVIPLAVAVVSYHVWEFPWLRLKNRAWYFDRPSRGVPNA